MLEWEGWEVRRGRGESGEMESGSGGLVGWDWVRCCNHVYPCRVGLE